MPWPYQQQQMYGMGQAPRGYGGLGAMQQYGMQQQQRQQQQLGRGYEGMMNAPVEPN